MIGMEANTMMVCSKASFFGKGTGTVALNRANELGRHTEKKNRKPEYAAPCSLSYLTL